jgi:hypothetical protein
MKYDDFISLLNSTYMKVLFCVKDYNHYRHCQIERKRQALNNGNTVNIVSVKLTEDNSETVSFLNKYNEEAKIFDFGRKGKATLKECWERIDITEIIEL